MKRKRRVTYEETDNRSRIGSGACRKCILGTGMQTEAAQWCRMEQAGGIRRTMDLTRQEHGAISMTPGIILMDQVICDE